MMLWGCCAVCGTEETFWEYTDNSLAGPYATLLRASYAMSSTHIAYATTRVPEPALAVQIRPRCPAGLFHSGRGT
eukprot:1486315-Rhodomonas_salina.1